MHPIIYTLSYFKFYPAIYAIVSMYHVYNYYEYAKVMTYYAKLLIMGKGSLESPKEEFYEWIYIEEELLEEEKKYQKYK